MYSTVIYTVHPYSRNIVILKAYIDALMNCHRDLPAALAAGWSLAKDRSRLDNTEVPGDNGIKIVTFGPCSTQIYSDEHRGNDN